MVVAMQVISGSTCRSCVCGHSPYRSTQRPQRPRRSVRVHAEESSQTQNKSAYKPDSQGGDPPGPTQPDKPKEAKPSGRLSFSPNTRSGIGYTDDDTAGQTNIFAVEPSQYVAGGGSVRDVGPDPKANIAIVTAASLAIAGIASGLITNFQSKPRAPIEDEPGQYLTLSQYKDKFAASEGVAQAPSVN